MDADGLTFASLDMEPGERFQRLRAGLGVGSFGLNLLRLEPGQGGRIHRHALQEEVYVVLEGELTLVVEGEERAVGRHSAVRVQAETRRQLVNKGNEPLRILAIGGAGEHAGRDGLAWSSWDEPEEAARPPQEVPLPEDLGD
jgi:uncharacterized cupin superfamily protein